MAGSRRSFCWDDSAYLGGRMSRWSLRFRCRSKEQAFLAYRADHLATNFSLLMLLGALCMARWLALTIQDWSTSGGKYVAHTYPQLVAFRNMQVVYMFCQSLLCAVLPRSRKFRSMLKPIGMEVWAGLTMTVSTVMMVTSDSWYAAKMFGVDPLSITTSASKSDELELLLYLDGVLTAAHLMLSVRWVMLIPVEVVALGCWAFFSMFLGSPSPLPKVLTYIFLLTILTVAAAIGRRQIEYHERIAFAQFVDEKALRFSLEHRLSKLEGVTDTAAASDAVTNGSGATGELFRRVQRGNSKVVAARLQELSQLGYQEHWLVPSANFRAVPEDILGFGGFGMVLRARYHGAPVALKASWCAGQMFFGGGTFASLANELRIFRRLRHPNIVLFLGACILPQSGELTLVLELVDGIPLGSFVAAPPSDPPTPERFMVANGIACALMYLHAQKPPIVHGDLKDSNVLVEGRAGAVNAKLIDFGLSRMITRQAERLGGTYAWMAPEVIVERGIQVDTSADTFSFGRLLYMIMDGRAPLEGVPMEAIIAAVREGRPHAVAWSEHVPLRSKLEGLSDACTRSDPSERPAMEAVQEILEALMGCRAAGRAAVHIEEALEQARALLRVAQKSPGEDASGRLACYRGSTSLRMSSNRSSTGSAPTFSTSSGVEPEVGSAPGTTHSFGAASSSGTAGGPEATQPARATVVGRVAL